MAWDTPNRQDTGTSGTGASGADASVAGASVVDASVAGASATDPTEQRRRVIVRTSAIGIAANVLLAAFKAVVGLTANSIAVVLDAVNNLSDALSSIIAIIGARLAGRAPDRKHPLGHGRYEYLSALVIAVIVLYAGITAGVESIKKIFEPEVPDYSTVALIIIAAAILVKLALGRYVSAKGNQVNSRALVASGKDALFDAVLSTSVLAAALIFIATGISLEAYVGVVIAAVIVKAGAEMVRDTIDDILGGRPDSEVSTAVKHTIVSDPDVMGAYDLLMHDYGPNLVVAEVHVEIPDTMSAAQIDEMTRRLQAAVAREHGIALSTVGIYSHNTSEGEVAEIRSAVTRTVMAHDGILQMHGFFVNTREKSLSFDMVVDFAVKDRDALRDEIDREVQSLYPDYAVRIVLDRDVSD